MELIKPWGGNRSGNPHQLLHEAAQLEVLAQGRRRAARRLRTAADEEEAAADQMCEAAADYRKWAQPPTE